jgi:hypothetical protein
MGRNNGAATMDVLEYERDVVFVYRQFADGLNDVSVGIFGEMKNLT